MRLHFWNESKFWIYYFDSSKIYDQHPPLVQHLLFYHHNSHPLYILIYVDDIRYTSNSLIQQLTYTPLFLSNNLVNRTISWILKSRIVQTTQWLWHRVNTFVIFCTRPKWLRLTLFYLRWPLLISSPSLDLLPSPIPLSHLWLVRYNMFRLSFVQISHLE